MIYIIAKTYNEATQFMSMIHLKEKRDALYISDERQLKGSERGMPYIRLGTYHLREDIQAIRRNVNEREWIDVTPWEQRHDYFWTAHIIDELATQLAKYNLLIDVHEKVKEKWSEEIAVLRKHEKQYH